MRFVCRVCGKDFTTLSNQEKKAFSIFLMDKMRCPNCGMVNQSLKLKPLRETRGRYKPKRMSRDTSDYPEPNISLHPLCQSRLVGSISCGGVSVMCEGCPSAFNCLTGNVDDGYKEPKTTPTVVSQEKMAKIQKDNEKAEFEQLKSDLGKRNFGYRHKDGVWYAQFGGTTWKLSEADVQEILNGTFQSDKTTQIKNTLNKRAINLESAQKLLRGLCENN